MPLPIVPLAIGAIALFLATGKKERSDRPTERVPDVKRVPEYQVSQYMARMGNTSPSGQPISHVPQGVVIYQWQWGSSPGQPTALDWIDRALDSGYVIWSDITILSPSRFVLAMAPRGITPIGDWAILLDNRLAVPTKPADARPIAKPSDLPPTPVPGDRPMPTPTPVPGPIPYGTPIPVPGPNTPAPNQTGFPEIDRLLVSPDATPYQLRQLAAELRRNGSTAEADVIDRRATQLYTQLRTQHTILGGTPFYIKDHHGGSVTGHLPSGVASHYGGSLSELGRANPGKRQWGDWQVGKTWLLPLSWDAEAKAPPPIAGKGKAPTPPKKATPPVVKVEIPPTDVEIEIPPVDVDVEIEEMTNA
jgi:hypothetical protein